MRQVFPVATLLVLAASLAHAAAPHHAKKGAAPHKPPAEVRLRPAPEDAPAPASAGTSSGAPTRGPTRIDFDDRLIQGQTNKSGAVYLYDRKELKTPSMVKKRETFRDEIVHSVYDT